MKLISESSVGEFFWVLNDGVCDTDFTEEAMTLTVDEVLALLYRVVIIGDGDIRVAYRVDKSKHEFVEYDEDTQKYVPGFQIGPERHLAYKRQVGEPIAMMPDPIPFAETRVEAILQMASDYENNIRRFQFTRSVLLEAAAKIAGQEAERDNDEEARANDSGKGAGQVDDDRDGVRAARPPA